MSFRRPSPSMGVALTALVLAASGTSIAGSDSILGRASGGITGAQIRDGSITARDIANNSITSSKIKAGSVEGSDLGAPVVSLLSKVCGQTPSQTKGSSLVHDKNVKSALLKCAKPVAERDLPVLVNSLVVIDEPVPGPAGSNGAAGTNGSDGTDGADAGVATSNRVTVASNVVFSANYAPTIGVTNATPGYAAAQTASPSVATTVRDVSAKIVRSSASNPPVQIGVSLVVNNGSPSGAGGSCSFDPRATDGCSFAGPIPVAAGSTMAWLITTNGQVPQGQPPLAWSDYDLSLGFRSTTD